jgi:hypothetical protein
MKKLFYIAFLFLFTGATEKEKITIAPRSFYAEMKALEKPPKANAFAAVQTASGVGTGTTTIVVNISSSGSNNLLVVSTWIGTGVTFVSLTDNLSTSYTSSSATTSGGAGNVSIVQSYAVVASGVTSVTVTLSTNVGPAGAAGVIVDEFSGNATSSVFDVSGTGSGTGTSLATSTFTPSVSGRLIVATIIGYLADIAGWTAGSGYTLYGQRDYSGYPIMRTQYNLSGSTSETAPATVSYLVLDEWAEIATAFKQAGAVNTTNFFFKPIPKPVP